MFDLKGKTALVTGSTQGIGYEIAKVLSDYGANVYIHGAESIEKCQRACSRIPNSLPVRANLLELSDIDKLYEETGDVDILVLNASIQYKKQWDEYTIEEYDDQMNCNVKSSYLLMKKYSEGMKKNGWGRIVCIGSVNQYNNHPELSVYGATKAAQMKLVLSVAKALAPFGITVNNIAPGAIDTPRNKTVLSDPELKKTVEGKIPCGYIGKPEDISPAVLMLCSDEGRYITGTDLKIDGGMSL
ncbi:MAG: SDR family oxidoreductase [Clostridia bacterium]|nr:SDR family oxidoreductase [Clostridia bacterium]